MPVLDLRSLVRRKRRRRVGRFKPLKAKPADVAELRSIYREMVELWERSVPTILASYRPIIADSPDDLRRVVEMTVLETNRALVTLQARIRNWTQRTERRHRAQWVGRVLAATDVDLSTVIHEGGAAMTMEAVLSRNTALIRNVADTTRDKISDIVFRGVTSRTPTTAVAAAIREAVDMSKRRADNIAADQTTKLYAALDRERQTEAGMECFRWVHSGKVHPRPWHQERDGTIYNWVAGEGPGEDPPDPEDMPGVPPFCGCIAEAVLLDEDGKPM